MHRMLFGTRRAMAGSWVMRSALPLALVLLLTACNSERRDKDGDSRPGVVTNIIDQSVPDADDMPAADNRITPVEPQSDLDNEEPQQTGEGPIPTALQGQWAGVTARCGDRSDDLELTIDPGKLIFHESVGTVDQVERKDDGYAVRASFTGEGQSWTRTVTLRPSADGRTLTMMNDGTAVTRKRC